ncbi:ATP-binding protein [Candidatus Methanarcanum hacksteinii]|uniref:ATP-binding protein n=1 Tax=Candidatus Methanarcanum hacksteinii TaxID=2911857 RepID=UPI0037DDCCA5
MNRGISEKDIMLIDLEKMRYVIDSERMLYDHISSNIRSDRPVILIDEVQLIKGWERALDSIRLKYDANIYITGSNSETVSESLGTHLTGRYVEIDIYSFSFKEFLSRYPIDNDNGYTQRFVQYLRYGGMPIIDLKDSQRKNRAILRGVYDSIINNDIRPGMDMDQALLNSMTSFLISNIGNLTTYGSIASRSYMKDQRTVEKYLGKLCGCFIFYKADKYDVIGERHLKSKAKYYLADTGFKDAILLGSEYDEGSLLENAVFIELMRRGYRVSVGSFKDREIDFTAWLDGAPEFYQVAWSINDPMALDREVRSLTKVEGKRVLITMDLDIPEVPDGIEVVRAPEFFLERD